VRQFLRRARPWIYALVVLAVAYLAIRFDTISLPEEGCSPVRAIAPGARILVDVRPGELALGDAVLFRSEGAALLLGLVAELPESAPQGYHQRVQAGELWIVADNPLCPARDSRALGPISCEDLAGRVVLAF
jgi:hypothetical protein